ncbi:lipoprotein insertase outer membrane protein LolB [Pseudoxanthomonas sp. CF125]|uniref:lipoprotein insertase outer membrane protein LolB n=1 Tax=Pseudoxanthomonas sp. CF125 TaxID=1855303 RepID=UPI000884116E|nr:lipoprotein insertase outer membrane protein LolB [Pseudoxanthomonas sp. CF125]SDQ96084.1 outer membrane lipoprotein LolB [Pseudoxanthomonas sp. CF125]
MIPLARFTVVGLSSLLLAACATRAPQASLPPPLSAPAAIQAAENNQAQRAAWLDGHRQWSFEGRVAINNAGKGGSGRIDWQQDGPRYVVSLSAPVTRQSWRLIGDTHSEAGRLEGLEGGPREGEDAEALLLEATGWDIPVNALARWAQGLSAEGMPVETQAFSTEGRLQTIEQAGWRIDYREWFDAAGQQPQLPRRIEAQRDRATVRLIVDSWDFSPQ